MRGTIKGYDYDVAYVHNNSDVTESTENGYSSQLAMAKLLSNNNAFNPYAATQTPALAAQIRATDYNGQMIHNMLSNNSLQAKVSGQLYTLPAGDLMFAVGGQLMTESLTQDPSAAYQSGDISGYGGQALPLDASRSSQALFGELSVPILKSLSSDLAVRTDRFRPRRRPIRRSASATSHCRSCWCAHRTAAASAKPRCLS